MSVEDVELESWTGSPEVPKNLVVSDESRTEPEIKIWKSPGGNLGI